MTLAVLSFLLMAAPPQPVSAAVLFQRAASALSSGDFEAAERGFEQVLKLEPNSVPALGNLGVTYSKMGRPADAIRVYRRALKLAPAEPGLMLNLGLAYLKQDDYTAAKPLFAKVDQSRGASPQSRELLATCELFTGNPEQALRLIADLPRSPEILFIAGTAHLRLKQQDQARKDFAELLSSTSASRAHYLLGRAYADNAQFEDAIVEFKQASDVPGSQLEIAKAHIGLRDNENAEKELRSILKDQPADPDANYYLGALLVLMSREDEAIKLLDQARSARPEAWGAYYYLGRAYSQQSKASKALPLLEAASKMNPNEAAVWFQLARVYQSAGRPADATQARNRYSALREASLEKTQQVLSPSR